MITPVWDFNKQAWVELEPWMRWSGYFWTKNFTEEQWEVALQNSVTDTEWTAILESRKRSRK